jgi:hypothetical protein
MDMIKVSANSRTSAVAGAIAGVIRENKHAEVQAIGAGAVNQATRFAPLSSWWSSRAMPRRPEPPEGPPLRRRAELPEYRKAHSAQAECEKENFGSPSCGLPKSR